MDGMPRKKGEGKDNSTVADVAVGYIDWTAALRGNSLLELQFYMDGGMSMGATKWEEFQKKHGDDAREASARVLKEEKAAAKEWDAKMQRYIRDIRRDRCIVEEFEAAGMLSGNSVGEVAAARERCARYLIPVPFDGSHSAFDYVAATAEAAENAAALAIGESRRLRLLEEKYSLKMTLEKDEHRRDASCHAFSLDRESARGWHSSVEGKELSEAEVDAHLENQAAEWKRYAAGRLATYARLAAETEAARVAVEEELSKKARFLESKALREAAVEAGAEALSAFERAIEEREKADEAGLRIRAERAIAAAKGGRMLDKYRDQCLKGSMRGGDEWVANY